MTANMNNIQSEKYEFPPEAFEENPVKNEKFGDIYNFYRLLNVQKHAKKIRTRRCEKGQIVIQAAETTSQS